MKKQETYMAPAIEIIRIETGTTVMAGSNTLNMGDGGDTNPFGAPTRSSSGSNVKSASPMQELEDMLNDIFTVKM